MPPKIEEISSENVSKVPQKPKKNPFEVKAKKTTVKRTADEVYPQRKGLNTPQYKTNKPIDLLFEKLQGILDTPYNELSVDVLYQRLNPDSTEQNRADKRIYIVEQLLDYLLQIQELSLTTTVNDDKNLMAISLHDIKTFSKLVNVIIIQGIYPALNVFRIGVEFEKRQLKNFSDSKDIIKIDKLPSDDLLYVEKLLVLIYSKFNELFRTKSDVTKLLMKGTGYTDFLIVAMTLITVPQFKSDHIYIEKLENISTTYELFQIYSLLLSTSSPQPFKQFVMSRVERLHYSRENGILSLIEFVLGLRDQDEINIEKFENVSSVILSKPKNVDTKSYFTSIGDQMYNLLVNINRPTVTSCVGFVLEKLWNRNKLVVTDFVLKKVWNNFDPKNSENQGEVLVSEAQLNNTINVLLSLTKKGLEPDLYKSLMQPILLSLWAYYLFVQQNGKSTDVILNIMRSYFTVMKDFDNENIAGLLIIAKNLLFKHGDTWLYEMGPNNLVQIVATKPEFTSISKEAKVNQFINDLDLACNSFVGVLQTLDESLIQELFVKILDNWLNKSTVSLGDEQDNPFLMLVDLRLLESIGEKFKEKLATNPIDMLKLVQSFLTSEGSKQASISKDEDDMMVDSDDEDDETVDTSSQTLTILLQLLSAILNEHEIIINDKCEELLRNIKQSLEKLKASSSTATSLCDTIDGLLNNKGSVTRKTSNADREILDRAVTSLNDPLAPIRAHGLFLLRTLVERKSPVIKIDMVIKLYLEQLRDEDPYVYLNTINGIECLIGIDEVVVLEKLIKIYNDDSVDIDEKVRIGEVFLQFIQKSGEMFTGKSAQLITESIMNVIRRTGNVTKDNRLRMSSMSLLGAIIQTNVFVVNLDDALDCCIGILELEREKDQYLVRRSAVVVISDIVLNTKVEFPVRYRSKVITLLNYVAETDSDYLTREHAKKVLEICLAEE
ncbi:RTP1 RNA polymerase II assembly factor RTP1 [Candida maltosa Xu316]|uniref:RNA polymerase II assembly factor Rtp1 C-terminal domain-containing protein n=1 Tax=Candida maltosa (strain Xu316) TaxID=1245528 RepID=M3J6K1_CANMX|nr:hypothetical protein G210_1904 [Candida maltosa Xu316]